MATIGIFDSGSGGLSVYREIVKLLPYERYVYFADNAHCPYGDKTAGFIQARARAITDFLLGKGADIIVVACNTATAAAIATLRGEYPNVPFVGMEPAVKPAALGTKTGVIGVLATAGTLKGSKYLNTKGLFEDDVRIVEHVGEGFVELVENGILDGPEAYATVKTSLQPLLDAGADRIVLGCTHYPFLRPVVEAIAGPGVQVIDEGGCLLEVRYPGLYAGELLEEAFGGLGIVPEIGGQAFLRFLVHILPLAGDVQAFFQGDQAFAQVLYLFEGRHMLSV